MFCNYCGAPNPDDAIFCHRCGKQRPVMTSPQAMEPASPPEVSSPYHYGGDEQSALQQIVMEQGTVPTSSPSLPPSQEPFSSPPVQQNRPRRSRTALSLLVVALLLLGSWAGFTYLNRSTPTKTLETVSTALKNNDLLTVYAQFSVALKNRLGAEPAWAQGQQTYYKDLGGLKNATVSSVSENGSSVSGLVTLAFGNGKTEVDSVVLINENNTWVIDKTAVKMPKGTISEFATDIGAFDITTGPDGNLWFTGTDINKFGRISTSGSLTDTHSMSVFAIPATNGWLSGITTGPDGNLWLAEQNGNKIARISPDGAIINEFPIPTANSGVIDITAGPDGNLWFTEFNGNKIGRISPNGSISEFAIPTTNSGPAYITAGPDGNLWFVEQMGNQIGRISPNGTISEFALPTGNGTPVDITKGPDGNLWFTEYYGDKIGRISPDGSISEFAVPTTTGSVVASTAGPQDITTGPDGNLWFTEDSANKIGRISPSGSISEFAVPTANSRPAGIITGPDGNLWFTEYGGNQIGRISVG